jgi:CDP-6-deoxy-D-xylo-4-hexulose-3-dehydrase
VIRHVDHVIHGELVNADRVHDHGLFVGNHHFDVRPGLDRVRALVNDLA